jgi:RHS repeat-associated protein
MNQSKRVRQRVLLLATDSNHSIIGEIVDGKTSAIGYSAFGEQSARQEVVTALGFNGQLLEATIGWYLLGNGYRAYNPRLMRFHSPDSWSPFGDGGLNSYAYCLNEPINSEDPTGHSPAKFLFQRVLAQRAQRASVIVKGSDVLQLTRPSVIVKHPKHPLPKVTQLATEPNVAPPKIQNPVGELAATSAPQSPTIRNIDATAAVPRALPSQPMIGAAHSQPGMPELKTTIDPYHRPLKLGKRKMPTLPISATEVEIKKMRWLNPNVTLIRIS